MTPPAVTLPPDYHTHTRLCKHAEDTPSSYARAGQRHGVAGLACTDHCPTDERFDIEHRMEFDEFETYAQWVTEARAQAEVPVLFGVEADYYPGCERFLKPWLKEQPLDLVLGSVHYLDYWTGRGVYDHDDVAGCWSAYFERIADMAATGLYDIASHLDLPKRFGALPPEAAFREMVLPALDALARHGMAVEINTNGMTTPAQECFPSPQILAWAHERDIAISFGSDAHSPERVGADFDLALRLARDAGYTQSVRYEKRQRSLVDLPSTTSTSY